MQRLIIGISGASGVIYGIRLLQILRKLSAIETHLIITPSAWTNLKLETKYSLDEVKSLADVIYDCHDLTASISCGSFQTIGMVILPCSIKTLSAIVHCYSNEMLMRAADVVLKERRRLVLCIRETPLHLGHLNLMTSAANLGAIIMPPIPGFYHRPQTLDHIIDQTVNRILDQFNIALPKDLFQRWNNK